MEALGNRLQSSSNITGRKKNKRAKYRRKETLSDSVAHFGGGDLFAGVERSDQVSKKTGKKQQGEGPKQNQFLT